MRFDESYQHHSDESMSILGVAAVSRHSLTKRPGRWNSSLNQECMNDADRSIDCTHTQPAYAGYASALSSAAR
jgi:hypothetical protein